MLVVELVEEELTEADVLDEVELVLEDDELDDVEVELVAVVELVLLVVLVLVLLPVVLEDEVVDWKELDEVRLPVVETDVEVEVALVAEVPQATLKLVPSVESMDG